MIIKSVNLETVCGVTSRLPENELPEFAFAGKSNVGKSSLINALMNRKAYARTSSQPGRPRPSISTTSTTLFTTWTCPGTAMPRYPWRRRKSGGK